jgi:PASTA domain
VRRTLATACTLALASGCAGGGHTRSTESTASGRDVIVPGAAPLYVYEAMPALRAAGLRVAIASIPPLRDVDAGTNGYAVRSQSPAAGTRVPRGTTVVLRLDYSLNGGPGGVGRPAAVPALVGMDVDRAIAAATSAGLHVTVPAVRHRVASVRVSTQSLPAGSAVAPGAVVTLTVGGGTTGAGAVLDATTSARLLTEYRGSLIPPCPAGSLCPVRPRGVFLTGRVLIHVLHRTHPSIPATTDMNETLSLDGRVVFVLADSSASRLDLATAAADGSYVHLIAVGTRPPRFRLGGL